MQDEFIRDITTGALHRVRGRTVSGEAVYESAVYTVGNDTWFALADAVVFAANKQHISLFNASGSANSIRIKKLFIINNSLASVTGVACRFDVKQISALSVGTAVTPLSADSGQVALPAQITCKTGATVTEGALWFPITVANDEVGATQAFPSSQLMAGFNWVPEGSEIKEITLNEGEGITVKQITSSIVGSFSWLLVFVIAPN
jgi:hypothetical protein